MPVRDESGDPTGPGQGRPRLPLLQPRHQLHYQDPLTGAHTQGIERSWLDAKVKIMKKMRGTTPLLMQGHLDEYCYRVEKRTDPEFFTSFLRDIQLMYR